MFPLVNTASSPTYPTPTSTFTPTQGNSYLGGYLGLANNDLEGFSGELPECIEQEIQAKILLHNITQAICHQAHQQLPPDKQAAWQVNRAHALKQIGRPLILGLKGCLDRLSRYVTSFTSVRPPTLERARPNRSSLEIIPSAALTELANPIDSASVLGSTSHGIAPPTRGFMAIPHYQFTVDRDRIVNLILMHATWWMHRISHRGTIKL